MFRAEVIADSSGKFCGNGLTFNTIAEAQTYVSDLMSRWILVTQTRIIDMESEAVVMVNGEHRLT